jgi:hypothetical protein
MCVIVNLDFEPHTHISYVDQTKCKVPPHTKYFKGCTCFVMSFGARTRTFPPHDASSEPPPLPSLFEGVQMVVEGSPLEPVVLARVGSVVIYVMGQPSIQRGHFGPATIQSSYNGNVRLVCPNHF